MKKKPSMVDDEHDDGVQSAAGVVVDVPPEWFKSKTTCSTSASGGAVELQWRQRRLLGGSGLLVALVARSQRQRRGTFPLLQRPLSDRIESRVLGKLRHGEP